MAKKKTTKRKVSKKTSKTKQSKTPARSVTKAANKKKKPAKRKTAVKKKATVKSTAAKKKAVSKTSSSKRKASVKKKAISKTKPAKNKATAKKKTVSKNQVTKRKASAKKKAISKTGPAKNKATAKKKTASKNQVSKRKPASKKKSAAKALTTKKAAKQAPKPTRNPFDGLSIRDCKRVAKSIFRINSLHEEQIAAMRGVLKGKDTLAVLPTGFGKSLIYQTFACLTERPVIAVSPLIALMRDQERALQRVKVPVARLDSSIGKRAREEALAAIKAGGRLVVLTTPETLESKDVRTALKKSPPALITIDEAHCISEWGHDFRPAYLSLSNARNHFGGPPILALTATATARVQSDINERLGMDKPITVIAPPHRANLRFDVRNVPGNIKLAVAGKLIRKLSRPGIIYCATTKAVDEIYGALKKAGIPATRYHGKMTKTDRERSYKQYLRRRARKVMVATSAFGMGIDKPNIRYIMHYQVPGSIEQYMQEAGRAGRDGRPAHCILLFDESDLDIQKRLITKSHVSVRQLEDVGEALCNWFNDGQSVAVEDLALSAAVQTSSCRALCNRLEEAGLVTKTESGKISVKVKTNKLREKVSELAQQFQIVQQGDLRRLGVISEYALSKSCRSVFLNGWFVDSDLPPCGTCDRCRSRMG